MFLSSGVDSVVVARVAADHMPDLRTYTVAFDTGDDEAAAAAGIARRLGVAHTGVPARAAEVLSALDDVVARMDQPTVDGVNSYLISQAVRRAGLVVALSGLGGDELFRGYSTFRHAPRIASVGRLARRVPQPVAASAIRPLARVPSLTHSGSLRAAEAALWGGERAAYAAVRGPFAVHEFQRLWPEIESVADPADGAVSGGDLPTGVCSVTRLEVANYLPFQLLRDTDAMSMSHALEVRVPLLDEQIVRVVLRRQRAGQPPFDKLALLRAVDPDLVPLAHQPKRTFTLPFATWMRGPLRGRVHDSVLGLSAAGLGFDRNALMEMFRSFQEGRMGWRPVWALTVLGMWLSATKATETAA